MTNIADQTSNQNPAAVPSALLEQVYQRLEISPDDRLSFFAKNKPKDGSEGLSVGTVKTAREITETKWSLDGTNYWFGINPMRPEATGRGGAKDVLRLTGLYADLDVKDKGFIDKQSALAFVDYCSQILGTNPALVIHSGNGIQPIWALEDDPTVSNDEAQAILKWFGNFIQMEADQNLGFKPDSVFDLSRVLRIPGTKNLKDPKQSKLTSLDLPDNWRPLSVSEVMDTLGARSIPVTVTPSGNHAVVPLKDWPVGETCPYVETMIAAWPSDEPTAGRHQWAASQVFRLTAALRMGCVSREDYKKAANILQARLKEMRDRGICGEKGETPVYEVPSLAKWAAAEASSRPKVEIEQELGLHNHAGSDADANRVNIDELAAAIKRDRSARSASQGSIDELEPLSAGDIEFWESRPLLAWINQLAKENMAVPVAVLATFLARYAAELPPQTRTSTGACLNLFVGLYGRSGTGKSTAMRAVKQCGVDWKASGGVPGSGEGVGRYFAAYDSVTKSWVSKTDNAYFEMDEISTLLGAKARKGNTLEGILNCAFTGESLQITYGSQDKSFKVDSYSMSLVAGVQPGIADEVASRTETGFAQRFLWVKSTDSFLSDNPGYFEEYEKAEAAKAAGNPLSASMMPRVELIPHRFVVGVPTEIRRGLSVQRYGKLGSDGLLDVSTTEGNHESLIRLKVAALFALLDGRDAINDQDWLYAGRLLANSVAVRDSIKEAAKIETRKAGVAAGRRQGEINEASTQFAVSSLGERVRNYIINNLRPGFSCSYRSFRKNIVTSKEDRVAFDSVMEELLRHGSLEKVKEGRQWRIVVPEVPS